MEVVLPGFEFVYLVAHLLGFLAVLTDETLVFADLIVLLLQPPRDVILQTNHAQLH